MNGIALLADRHTVTCLKLAGLTNVFAVKDHKEAENQLFSLLEKGNLRIILVSERLMNQINVFDKISEHAPAIIPIPDLQGQVALKTDLIAALIRRKTGIEVKL